MERKGVSAVFLTLIMLLSGCLGSEDSVKEIVEDEESTEIFANYSMSLSESIFSVGDIVVVEGIVEINQNDAEYFFEYDVITPSGIRPVDVILSEFDSGMRLILMPDEPGEWKIVGRLIVSGLDDSLKSDVEFEALPPNEGETTLSVDSIIEMEYSAPLSISGRVIHLNPTSLHCF